VTGYLPPHLSMPPPEVEAIEERYEEDYRPFTYLHTKPHNYGDRDWYRPVDPDDPYSELIPRPANWKGDAA
jgi:hypothetical protein